MRFPIITGGALAVVLALAGPLAGAQESGLDAAFKIRAGMGLASSDDHLQPRTMGLGFELGYAGTWGRFGAEAGYQYKPPIRRPCPWPREPPWIPPLMLIPARTRWAVSP